MYIHNENKKTQAEIWVFISRNFICALPWKTMKKRSSPGESVQEISQTKGLDGSTTNNHQPRKKREEKKKESLSNTSTSKRDLDIDLYVFKGMIGRHTMH